MTLQTLNDAKGYINTKDIFNVSDSFELSKFCLKLLKSKDKQHWGREIAIRVLDNILKFPSETKELWNDIVEISGLYPYVNPALLNDSALLRFEYHKSKNIN